MCKQITDAYWIVCGTKQYLEPRNLVNLCYIESLEIELFNHLIVYIYKMCLQIIYLICTIYARIWYLITNNGWYVIKFN